MKKLFIELFHFDKSTDYLPYYKKQTLKYDNNTSINDLLDTINQLDSFCLDKSKTINVKINHLYTNANTKVNDIVEVLGNDWKIEPISIYRATKDFVYDNSDFLASIALFDKYLNYSQKQHYTDNYELVYYASNSINLNRDYIGDVALYIAYDLISQNPSLKDEILAIITNENSGICYHTSLENRIFAFANQESKIASLFGMAGITYKKPSYLYISDIQIAQKFDGFNISAYMPTTQTKDLIKNCGGTYIDISTAYNDIAICNLKSDNKKFSLKLIGEFLLDAKDNNADLVIVDDEYLSIFDGMQCNIENAVGREIKMPILSKTEFTKILGGNKDTKALGLDKHKVGVSL